LPEPLVAAAGLRVGNEERKNARNKQSVGESEIESGTCWNVACSARGCPLSHIAL